MLSLILSIFAALRSNGVLACQWKSNHKLKSFLEGEGDLDLLFREEDLDAAERIFSSLGLLPGGAAGWIRHYYGFDAKSGRLVHVHAYYRLITGGGIIKNHRFPLESLLLSRGRTYMDVPVMGAPDDFALFTVRKMLESVSVIEAFMLHREYKEVMVELAWHRETDPALEGLKESGRCLFPEIPPALWVEAVHALAAPGAWISRFIVGRKFRKALRERELAAKWGLPLKRTALFLRKVAKKLRGGEKARLRDGAVVAVVGHDASGKSTVSEWISSWFSEWLDVDRVHAGKPPPSPLTAFPRIFRRALRLFYFNERAHPGKSAGKTQLITRRSFLYGLRSIVIAYDRLRLLKRARHLALRGKLVVCDRYPDARPGGVDGPELSSSTAASPFNNRLAKLEEWIYRQIPPPDVIVRVSVPVEVALERNRKRAKDARDEDEFLRLLYAGGPPQVHARKAAVDVTTDKSEEATRREAIQAVCLALR